jgi:hypothetical protein
VHHEIERVAEAGAAGFAAQRLHLGDVGTHPGERLGAGRAGLELRQVKDADALEEAGRHGGTVIVELLILISSDRIPPIDPTWRN